MTKKLSRISSWVSTCYSSVLVVGVMLLSLQPAHADVMTTLESINQKANALNEIADRLEVVHEDLIDDGKIRFDASDFESMYEMAPQFMAASSKSITRSNLNGTAYIKFAHTQGSMEYNRAREELESDIQNARLESGSHKTAYVLGLKMISTDSQEANAKLEAEKKALTSELKKSARKVKILKGVKFSIIGFIALLTAVAALASFGAVAMIGPIFPFIVTALTPLAFSVPLALPISAINVELRDVQSDLASRTQRILALERVEEAVAEFKAQQNSSQSSSPSTTAEGLQLR